MSSITKLTILIVLASGTLIAQPSGSAKQTVTFGIVRSSQSRLVNSLNTHNVVVSLPAESVGAAHAAVPAKITIATQLPERRIMLSRKSERRELGSDVGTMEMDLQSFVQTRKALSTHTEPFLITVTE